MTSSLNTNVLVIILLIAIFTLLTIIYLNKKNSKGLPYECLNKFTSKKFSKTLILEIFNFLTTKNSNFKEINLSNNSSKIVDGIFSFCELASCEYKLNPVDFDCVLKSNYKNGTYAILTYAINTKNEFYIFNTLTNTLMFGDKEKKTTINLDVTLKINLNDIDNIKSHTITIDNLVITKVLSLSL